MSKPSKMTLSHTKVRHGARFADFYAHFRAPALYDSHVRLSAKL